MSEQTKPKEWTLYYAATTTQHGHLASTPMFEGPEIKEDTIVVEKARLNAQALEIEKLKSELKKVSQYKIGWENQARYIETLKAENRKLEQSAGKSVVQEMMGCLWNAIFNSDMSGTFATGYEVAKKFEVEHTFRKLCEAHTRLQSRVEKLKKGLEEISAKKKMTVASHSVDFMDGAHTAFCQAAEIADEKLAEDSKLESESVK